MTNKNKYGQMKINFEKIEEILTDKNKCKQIGVMWGVGAVDY